MSDLGDVLDGLNAERYAPAHWWATPPTEHPETPGVRPNFDDSEVACARRRKAAADEADQMQDWEASSR